MKMTFLLFCVIILNDTRFFSTSFAFHCCLVWCVGVPQSFFTVHNECEPHIWGSLKSKKKIETSFEIPFPLSRRSDRSDPVVGHFLTSLSYTFEGPKMMYDLIITFVFILYILPSSVLCLHFEYY